MKILDFVGQACLTFDTQCMSLSLVFHHGPNSNIGRSFHKIIGEAVDVMHTSNITSTYDLTLSQLVPHVMELLRQLEVLRNDATPYTLLVSKINMNGWLAADFDSERYAILLSLYYHRVALLINAPLLLAVLGYISTLSENKDPGVHVRLAMTILQTYLQTIEEFHNLLCTILRVQRAFLKRNGVWWLCNYMSEFWQVRRQKRELILSSGLGQSSLIRILASFI